MAAVLDNLNIKKTTPKNLKKGKNLMLMKILITTPPFLESFQLTELSHWNFPKNVQKITNEVKAWMVNEIKTI